VYTSQLLRGALNAVLTVIRDEAKLGLHICSLSPETFVHFFRLSAWFLQYCRYTEEASIQCAPCSRWPAAVPPSQRLPATLCLPFACTAAMLSPQPASLSLHRVQASAEAVVDVLVRVSHRESDGRRQKGAPRPAGSSMYQSVSSLLSWELIGVVSRTWLLMADTHGQQKSHTDWDLQEAAIKVLRCAPSQTF
jgi:hypothetical protein